MRRLSTEAIQAIKPHLPDHIFISFPENESDAAVVCFQKLRGEVQRINDRLVGYRILHDDIPGPLANGIESSWYEAIKRVLLAMEATSIVENSKRVA